MGQRNMPCSCQMIDLEMDQQGQCHLHPEPCVLFGSATNFAQPNIHTILPAPGGATNFDVRHLPERHDTALFYGITQYSGVQHHHPAANLELGVATASHYHNSYMTPSGTRVFPLPQNHGSHEQLPSSSNYGTSSSNYGIIGVPSNDYGRNNFFMDGIRDSFKRKNAEGIPGNFQYHNASAGSSSSVVPLNTRPFEYGVTMVDAASFGLPEYRVNGIPAMMDGASHRTGRNRSGAIGLDSATHNPNHLIQGNYIAQPFQMASTPWLDQQFNSNGGDGGTSTWNQAPALTYLHGTNVNGSCIEAGNMGVQGYHETASNRNSINFLHPPIPQGHQSLHHSSPIQGVRGHDINFHRQVAAPQRLSTNSASHSSMNPFQDGMEVGPRYAGPVSPTGLRIYRPQRREVMFEATSRHRNLPHLRVLPADEVAILEISGNYEVRNSIDHHREMRLDIDHMSYEELLALGERIGDVGTGLTEETIIRHLKTRTYLSSTTCPNLEEMACVDQETDFCVICQTDYKNQEKIGILDCGHNYHVECIKKWLYVKNACPICKSSALTTERKDL